MCEGGGGSYCLNTLKGGGIEQGRGHKDFIERGKAGSRVGCLKKGGWNPITNYDIRTCAYQGGRNVSFSENFECCRILKSIEVTESIGTKRVKLQLILVTF